MQTSKKNELLARKRMQNQFGLEKKHVLPWKVQAQRICKPHLATPGRRTCRCSPGSRCPGFQCDTWDCTYHDNLGFNDQEWRWMRHHDPPEIGIPLLENLDLGRLFQDIEDPAVLRPKSPGWQCHRFWLTALIACPKIPKAADWFTGNSHVGL